MASEPKRIAWAVGAVAAPGSPLSISASLLGEGGGANPNRRGRDPTPHRGEG